MTYIELKAAIFEFTTIPNKDISYLQTQYDILKDKIEEFYLNFGDRDLVDIHSEINRQFNKQRLPNPFIYPFITRLQTLLRRKAKRNSKHYFFESDYMHLTKNTGVDKKIEEILPKLIKEFNDNIGIEKFNDLASWEKILDLNHDVEVRITKLTMLLYLIEKTGYIDKNEKLTNDLLTAILKGCKTLTSFDINKIANHFEIKSLLHALDNIIQKENCEKSEFYSFILIGLKAYGEHGSIRLPNGRKKTHDMLLKIGNRDEETLKSLGLSCRKMFEDFLEKYNPHYGFSASSLSNYFETKKRKGTYNALIHFICYQNSNIITKEVEQYLNAKKLTVDYSIFGYFTFPDN